MKIKKDDKILVISGKDKGKEGKVLKVFHKKATLLVENVNLGKKHVKPRREGEKGQIVEVPAPVHVSNVKFLCLKCRKASRLGYKKEKKEKHRICKKCGQGI